MKARKSKTLKRHLKKEKKPWRKQAKLKPMTADEVLKLVQSMRDTPPWFMPDKPNPYWPPGGVCVFDEFDKSDT